MQGADKEIENSKYFLENRAIPTLNDEDKTYCNNNLSECSNALKLLPNNKSPGSDGPTTNFYKFFWIDTKDLLFDSYIYKK